MPNDLTVFQNIFFIVFFFSINSTLSKCNCKIARYSCIVLMEPIHVQSTFACHGHMVYDSVRRNPSTWPCLTKVIFFIEEIDLLL